MLDEVVLPSMSFSLRFLLPGLSVELGNEERRQQSLFRHMAALSIPVLSSVPCCP